jgi:hypothetical protein
MSSAWPRRVGALAITLSAVACRPVTADDNPASGSGISGIAVVDVGCPTLPSGQTCPTQPMAARLDFRPVGSTGSSTSTTTAADGRFTIDLQPGTYHLVATSLMGGPGPSAESMNVRVTDGRFTQITVRFDSGVR